MTAAITVALASALCFALAATLQQREAALQSTLGASDPRLLWRLAHQPWWLVGITADLLSAGLHVWALSLGSIAVVQPVGVTGLLFAIPMVAVLRRRSIPIRDVGAALVVLAGLVLFLALVPHQSVSGPDTGGPMVWVIAGALGFLITLIAGVHLRSGHTRAVLLAAGAGIAFGVVAVLARAILLLVGHSGPMPIVTAGIGIVLLAGIGYLMLQHAYRAGHFAASLATAVVIDPPAAIIAGALALHETLPNGPIRLLLVVVSAVIVTAGISVLVRSPTQVLTLPRPQSAANGGGGSESTKAAGP